MVNNILLCHNTIIFILTLILLITIITLLLCFSCSHSWRADRGQAEQLSYQWGDPWAPHQIRRRSAQAIRDAQTQVWDSWSEAFGVCLALIETLTNLLIAIDFWWLDTYDEWQ